jgi:very-short-patch-repair endonuclease
MAMATTGIVLKGKITEYGKQLMISLCKQEGIADPVEELKFAKEAMNRLWRFDYAWPDSKIALEIEGGVWIRGRHTSPKGFIKDMEKYNAASILGWRIIRAQPKDVLLGIMDVVRAHKTEDTTNGDTGT